VAETEITWPPNRNSGVREPGPICPSARIFQRPRARVDPVVRRVRWPRHGRGHGHAGDHLPASRRRFGR